MGEVVKMGQTPVEFVVEEVEAYELVGCVLVGVEEDGNYVLTATGMTPEQLLMMGKMIEEKAMDMLIGLGDSYH